MLRFLLLVSVFAVLASCSNDNEGPPEDACVATEVMPRESCTPFCDNGIRCEAFSTPQDVCEGFCECLLQFAEETSEACAEAQTAENACLAALTCDDFERFIQQLGDYPCRDEVEATNELCFPETPEE